MNAYITTAGGIVWYCTSITEKGKGNKYDLSRDRTKAITLNEYQFKLFSKYYKECGYKVSS